MLRFVGVRLLQAIPALIGITLVAFLLIHFIPGNPAQVMLFGSNPTPQQVTALEKQLGLNRPIYEQYWSYMVGLFHGNLGDSFATGRPVSQEIFQRLPSTFALAGAAMLVAVVIGVPLGVVAGLKPRSIADRIARLVSVSGVAIPFFWLALILILVLAVRLRIFPAVGSGGIQYIILPAIALGWGYAAILTRLLRSKLIEELGAEYIRTARSKGASEVRILMHHTLRNAVIPTITMVGLQIGNILTAAAVIEVIFGRGGLGSFLVQSIVAKNIPVVQGTVLVIGVAYVLINLVVDLVVGLVDPRTRAAARS